MYIPNVKKRKALGMPLVRFLAARFVFAPRVAIADGAKFRGGIDMNGKVAAPATKTEAAHSVKTTAAQSPTAKPISRSA